MSIAARSPFARHTRAHHPSCPALSRQRLRTNITVIIIHERTVPCAYMHSGRSPTWYKFEVSSTGYDNPKRIYQMRQLSFASFIVLWSHCHQAVDAQSLSDLATKTFDFVIIGGGTAGSVIANRLTENPKFNVLVIEAGPSNDGVLDIMVPAFAFGLANTAYDWNFTMVPQVGLNGRVLTLERGHVLGGSSSVNGMDYTRGSSDDYDRFARVTGDQGWSWNNLQPYILRCPPADGHNVTGEFDPRVHGFDGINFVSLGSNPLAVDQRVIQTTVDLKDEFPFSLDVNSGKPLGVSWVQSTIGQGERSNAARTYLAPKYRSRPNLHIVLNTFVTRVLPTGVNGPLDLRVVEIASNATGPRIRVTATKEVITSAGSIGTPHILLNSGIGDKADLAALGIKSILNLSHVGKNLHDHPTTSVAFLTIGKDVPTWQTNATVLAENLAQWEANRTGPLVQFLGHHVAWTRIPSNSSIFKQFPDPSAGPNTPHLELTVGRSDGSTISCDVVAVTPTSTGTVKLRSNNPFDDPLIDPQFLTSNFDLFALREGIRTIRRFYSGPAWKGYIVAEIVPGANVTSDDDLNEYIRNTVSSFAHPVSTAKMSPKGASNGVVDPDLRLKGAKGLRIVDASVMPFVTAGHTQAPVYIIAERAADIIKAAW
ncbi:GMC oxidoreductase [Sphaerobolus stellatus SS14]|uniref:GMC oxidoreductase n=1 Tax=Sphaerobolus stellatus (strain SS14) TaxID=990650 RepID=A0A0C9W5V5_SPHS4|nr:GMC oxidoreductase [Sphaerobolus stellatus SS14]